MTNREKTEWLGRYRREAARQQMLCREVEALRAEAERVARTLGTRKSPGLRQVRTQLQAACKQLDAQAARCLTLRRQLVWAVSRLDDERQREVLLRRFLQGQTVQQAADEMGVVSEYTVEGQLLGHLVQGVSALGRAAEKLGTRKAEMVNMGTRETGMTHLEFKIPARGLMGYRSEFLTDTNGNGIMNHVFDGYEPYKGDIVQRQQGSLIAHETGEATGYGLFAAQDRGKLFIGPGVEVYEGMIVGASPKNEDIVVNVCKKKHVTNTRAAGSDEALKLTPPTILSLEQSLEFIADDELVEVTPKSIRMRKQILSKELRMKKASRKK